MKWYGLTGGWATGKSSVGRILKNKGVPVVEADALAHLLMQADGSAIEPLRRRFGAGVFARDGAVDRKKLGSLVFSDAQKLKLLEDIVHPLVRVQVLKKKQQLQKLGAPRAFYEVPLLFEKNMAALFDAVVVVHCSAEQQLARLQAQSDWSAKAIAQRLKQQWPLEKKLQLADYVLPNTQGLEALQSEVDKMLRAMGSC